MSEDDGQTSKRQPKEIRRGIVARIGQILFVFIFLGMVLFLAAGTLKWTAAWVYLGISVASVLVNAFFMLRTNPETVAERGQAKGWRDWDKLVSGLWALIIYLILPLVAGLDTRFHWSGEMGWVGHGIGVLVYSISLAISGWAMITNAYFSTAARVQTERGQTVCTSGPYGYVRHPGYASFFLQSIGMAVLLGSWWALIPAVCSGALMVARTALEDRMLQHELEGYVEYTQEVKYRLLPGVW
jgi:protein-S-isoprenylcysteine O-methyltransferase Ste14